MTLCRAVTLRLDASLARSLAPLGTPCKLPPHQQFPASIETLSHNTKEAAWYLLHPLAAIAILAGVHQGTLARGQARACEIRALHPIGGIMDRYRKLPSRQDQGITLRVPEPSPTQTRRAPAAHSLSSTNWTLVLTWILSRNLHRLQLTPPRPYIQFDYHSTSHARNITPGNFLHRTCALFHCHAADQRSSLAAHPALTPNILTASSLPSRRGRGSHEIRTAGI